MRVGNYEIREILYDHDRYEIVKWEDCEPFLTEAQNGQMKYASQYCYTIAYLIWDEDEEVFNLESIGMRLAHAAPPPEVFRAICIFADNERYARIEGDE